MRRSDVLLELLFYAAAAIFLLSGFGLPDWRHAEFQPGTRAPGELRVVTWNLGGSSDRSLSALRDEHIPAIARTLLELDPDLVCVQEVGAFRQMELLASSLGPSWTILVSGRGSRRVAALAQGGELDANGVSGTEARSLGFEVRSREHPALQGLVLHADAFSAQARNRAIGRATEALVTYAGERPHLLLGDLNLDLDMNKRRDLFTDNEYLDVETYNFIAQRMTDATLGTGPTAEPDRRLDYIFVDPDHLSVSQSGPWRGQRVGDMDHDPVVADLAFTD